MKERSAKPPVAGDQAQRSKYGNVGSGRLIDTDVKRVLSREGTARSRGWPLSSTRSRAKPFGALRKIVINLLYGEKAANR